jgi:hypothetical protein
MRYIAVAIGVCIFIIGGAFMADHLMKAVAAASVTVMPVFEHNYKQETIWV